MLRKKSIKILATRSLGLAIGIISLSWANLAGADPIARNVCSPVNGQWSYEGRLGPKIWQSGDKLTVDMSAYGRPMAKGQMISPTQIKVTFPDDATFLGTLDGRGQISWNNGTVWRALDFAGTWNYEDVPGPVITQLGDRLKVNMTRYRRPTATGTITAPSLATIKFPDDATHTATLVSPSCIQWSNSTTWTKPIR